MFQTANCSRHPVYSAFAGDGHHVWSQVELVLSRPWFFVSFLQRNGEEETVGNIFLSLLEQLIELSKLQSPVFSVNEVLLVSPGWLNETGGWQMERLHSVWRCADTSGAVLYRLEGGREYVESPSAGNNHDQWTCVAPFF